MPSDDEEIDRHQRYDKPHVVAVHEFLACGMTAEGRPCNESDDDRHCYRRHDDSQGDEGHDSDATPRGLRAEGSIRPAVRGVLPTRACAMIGCVTGNRRAPVAVVTGASRGLGEGLAQRLSDLGYRLAVCATTPPTKEGCLARALDVADGVAVEAFAAEVREQLGAIDVWINNAGVIGPVGVVADVQPEEWGRCIEVNVIGTLNGCRAFLPRRSASSTLINIASRAGVAGVPGLAAYSATKAAVIALTESLAKERLPGLSTFVVVPSSIQTDMQDGLLNQPASAFPGVVDSLARRDAGAILSVADATTLILDATLGDQRPGPVIDLTDVRTDSGVPPAG